ncbi:MAG: fibronectin type III domain-containing protein, partial [Gemmatimonadota bacterium]|nr:fibronectin type III domain-containing protein [Gemmatimonadota bacterium]
RGDTSDPGARDINAAAPTTLTDSWRLADAATLPNTARNYPTQDYLDGSGVISRVETISFFLHPDTISGRSDIYVLYRRVNARDSVEVVRSLQVPADSAFFSYHRPVGTTLTRIAAARLPLYWDSLAIDSVTGVGVRAAGYFRDKYTGRISIRAVNWTTVIPNARGRLPRTCGAAPGAPTNLVPTKVTAPAPYRVRLTWNASADDNGGELDVQYYALEWRVQGGGTWQPLGTAPATRAATYQWNHASPRVVGTYEYAIRAVDCAGLISAQAVGSAVVLP